MCKVPRKPPSRFSSNSELKENFEEKNNDSSLQMVDGEPYTDDCMKFDIKITCL